MSGADHATMQPGALQQSQGSGQPPAAQMFTPIMPQWQTFPTNTGPSTNIGITAKPIAGETEWNKQLGDYLNSSMKWGAGLNALNSVANLVSQYMQYRLANNAMSKQAQIANKYYDTDLAIKGLQSKVAIKQLGVQNNAITMQGRMHSNQIRHEEVMSRLEGSTQARLAAIAEQGKTDRAKILSASDAFNRRGYNYGIPA